MQKAGKVFSADAYNKYVLWSDTARSWSEPALFVTP